jgi:hypothetical protein
MQSPWLYKELLIDSLSVLICGANTMIGCYVVDRLPSNLLYSPLFIKLYEAYEDK